MPQSMFILPQSIPQSMFL